jgi:hypothetical protein
MSEMWSEHDFNTSAPDREASELRLGSLTNRSRKFRQQCVKQFTNLRDFKSTLLGCDVVQSCGWATQSSTLKIQAKRSSETLLSIHLQAHTASQPRTPPSEQKIRCVIFGREISSGRSANSLVSYICTLYVKIFLILHDSCWKSVVKYAGLVGSNAVQSWLRPWRWGGGGGVRSTETSVTTYGVTTQKTNVDIFTAVRTSNLTRHECPLR